MKRMQKGVATKEKVLRTAIQLFSQHGFEKTSFEMIAKKSRVSATAPFYYFKTKETLIEAAITLILSHNSELTNEIMRPEHNALERLKKHFQLNLEWARRFPEEAQVILLVYYMATFDKHWAQIYSRILAGARRKILEYVHAGKREKLFHFKISPDILTEILHDALLGGIVNALSIQQVDENSFRGVLKKWDFLIEELVAARS